MRKKFFQIIHNIMNENKNIFILTADVGYKILDDIKMDFEDRFSNVGAAEQALIGAGIGLALSNKIPICYTITPFLLYRPFELIRNYINNEKIPVKLVGSGRGKDYGHDGFSHWCEDENEILNLFPNIKVFKPNTEEELELNTKNIILDNNPTFISLRK